MLNIIRKGQKEEGPEGCEQEIEKRVEENLGEESGELKAERSDIDDGDFKVKGFGILEWVYRQKYQSALLFLQK